MQWEIIVVEIKAGMSNYIPLIHMNVITYPWLKLNAGFGNLNKKGAIFV